ncbi:RNA polymerase sigma factor RpoH [Bradyrhizobium canariense]|uniref:RNA polymerase sigma factor RpoH n=1 Tax=Bradyrhizobium canariense TaxID=255045 RepID=A0ABX3WZP2_9BRAD|nr:RNA polymerase sigma factor RpoH [Bradyrhizobium canariense]OSI22485.1 RNA polymerase subunit sigma-70 [Bradyrhizobium canariense]OSI28100.1 RNA polymerase subunit sigma-70 [Bradyrhizobium canariense]OSI46151.1 RNA polymerase subunit sigma-70 [Bradyrhizobium canariense]OSI48470.1 RNA polymerase subunit sigma-70 [Bradyrhizobium canariense]OSI53507.1 RNA polymerase subunit sigma-70 [Bradyrhizobium canariense]
MQDCNVVVAQTSLETTAINWTESSPFGRYAGAIRRFEMLEQEQEQQLARRWQELGDQTAADALVTSHLRLAASVAKRYRGYGLPLADIISEANLGLVMAATRYEAGRGSRFSTYALWWIKATIHDYILRSWSLVKIGTTAAQKKLFFSLRREMRKFASETSSLTPEVADAIAKRLEVSPRDVLEMDSRLNGDLSLNRLVSEDSETVDWQSRLVDPSPTAEALLAEHDESEQQARALRAAVDTLTSRERRVFEARRLNDRPATLEVLACELSISSERVRQIETCAFEKVKRAARRNLRPDRSASNSAPEERDKQMEAA